MSSHIWLATGSNVPLLFSGRLRFEDMYDAVTGKDEWGMDTLERTMRGPVYLLETFLGGLRQGDVYRGYYLQTWEPDHHPYAPSVTLRYKGLSRGIPEPLHFNSRPTLTGTVSAGDLHVTVTTGGTSGTGGVIVSAIKEVQYIAPQTVWRYISKTEPEAAKYGVVRGVKATGEGALQILDSRIDVTFDDGYVQTMTGNAPAAVVTALATRPSNFVVGPDASPVVGTPYWEAVETVQFRYPGS